MGSQVMKLSQNTIIEAKVVSIEKKEQLTEEQKRQLDVFFDNFVKPLILNEIKTGNAIRLSTDQS